MTIPELEAALRKAQERLSGTMESDSQNHMVQVLSFEALGAARDGVLQAERNLAAGKGEPFAFPIDFPVSWDVGAPLPYLLQNDYKTFLTFFVRDLDPDWDGTYVSVRSPNSESKEKLAVVEFDRCKCTRMGTPNEEVLHGHPLGGKGLAGYQAMSVKNSPWLRELEVINSVHSCYKAEVWRDLNHYILPFHDCTFECVARGFRVEEFRTTLPELLAEVCRRLVQ
jgi:hypothetical protein